MHEVFISYKTNEPDLGNNDETVAKELYQQIKAAGISCWMAPIDLPGGCDYSVRIRKAIKDSKIALVVFSRFTDKSRYVPQEVRIAFDNGKVIIPFNLDRSPVNSDRWDLHLGGSQCIDASGDYRLKIPELITALRNELGLSDNDREIEQEISRKNEEKESEIWPPAEQIQIDIDLNEVNEDSPSWKDRLKGAGKVAAVALAVGGGLPGSLVAGLAGAAKPDLLDFKKEKEEPSIKTFTVEGVSFKMIRVEGGTFQMGANSRRAKKDEKPAHNVTLSSYYLGETLVTKELWQAIMGNKPESDHPLNPVDYISWNDCQAFIKELNEITGEKFRLPTEAEWEFAARSGNKGKKIGLDRLNGEYGEWCQDFYGKYDANDQLNPTGPVSGESRVCRGGRECHYVVSSRDYYYPHVALEYLSFRLAL